MTDYTAQEGLYGLVRLISSDALAITHQSIRSYREMLLKSASDTLARLAQPSTPVGVPALFLGGPKDGMTVDLAELRSTFVEFESPKPVSFDADLGAPFVGEYVRVVYQLHRFPGDRAFYVDSRVENPVALIKQHL